MSAGDGDEWSVYGYYVSRLMVVLRQRKSVKEEKLRTNVGQTERHRKELGKSRHVVGREHRANECREDNYR